MDLTRPINYHLDPGYIYVSSRGATVRTVVGSCVAVCLWDKVLRHGGMNHFLYPVIRDIDKATDQYGNVATAALVKMMEETGCRRVDLLAQILGGASPEGARRPTVGEENVHVARAVLSRKGIAVVSEDTGGIMGRKVLFDMGTGQSVVMKVYTLRSMDWHN